MTCLLRGLVVLGFVVAVPASLSIAGAETAAALPMYMQEGPDDDVGTSMEPPVDTPTPVPTFTPTVIPTFTPTPMPTATPTPNPTAVAAGLQQVIQRSNDQQVQAIATRNLSLIADTLTADHNQELTFILQDMLNSKVNAIALLNLDWGPIVVAPDGSSAVVTTFETWRIVSQAGTVDDAPIFDKQIERHFFFLLAAPFVSLQKAIAPGVHRMSSPASVSVCLKKDYALPRGLAIISV